MMRLDEQSYDLQAVALVGLMRKAVTGKQGQKLSKFVHNGIDLKVALTVIMMVSTEVRYLRENNALPQGCRDE